MSSTNSSRRYQQSEKVVMPNSRESSTGSRSSNSTSDRDYDSYYSSNRSDRSEESSNFSSSRTDDSRGSDRVFKFRDYNADNFEGTYTYSSSGVKVINHRAGREEPRDIVHSSHATSKDYRNLQQERRENWH